MHRPAVRLLALCLLGLAFGASPLLAASVTLLARDEFAVPIDGILLQLTPPYEGSEISARERFERTYDATTDANGRAVFSNVAPGPYVVMLPGEPARKFVPPFQNPLAPHARVTVRDAGAAVSAEVTLWRGSSIVCGVTFEGPRVHDPRIRLREVDTGFETEYGLGGNVESRFQVVAGRWEARLVPPAGYVLKDLQVDGTSIDGHVAVVDLRPDREAPRVHWTVAASATLSGRVAFDVEPYPVEVRARLLDPGSWIDAARARGGSQYETVRVPVDLRDGGYGLALPDGRWEVSVAAGPSATVEPPSVEVALDAGGVRSQDFRVVEGSDARLRVGVFDPSGRRRIDATVEVWPLDGGRRDESPLAKDEATRAEDAVFRDLPEGDVLVVARSPRYLDATLELRAGDPARGERHELRLREGASIEARATDPDGVPVAGIVLTLDPVDGNGGRTPEGTTDDTGMARIDGVRPGGYRVRGAFRSVETSTSFVRVRQGERWEEQVELSLDAGKTASVELRTLPATELLGRATCACPAGSTPPTVISVVALPAGIDPSSLDAGEWEQGAALRIDRLALAGERRDRFTAAPLAPGAYRLAVRPAGHERWTWAPGVEDPSRATIVEAHRDEVADVGVLAIDCGPAIEISLAAASGAGLPDLREPGSAAVPAALSGTAKSKDFSGEIAESVADAYAGRVVLRCLPLAEGEVDLVANVHNDHFLPRASLRVPIRAKLERGKTLVVSATVEGVGGALRVVSTEGQAARVEGPVVTTTQPLVEGTTTFASLPAGSYRVALCGDAACGTRLREWPAVVVEARKTAEVR